MEEKTLAKLSLASGILGLLLLFIASLFAEPATVEISALETAEDRDVTIKGEVMSIKNFGSISVVEVAEVKSANVVVFDRRMLGFGIGDNITVRGEIRNYKGKREIVAGSIKVSG